MHADPSFSPVSTGTQDPDCHTVSPSCGATGKAQKDDTSCQPAPTGLDDASREEAIQRAAALVEYLHALSQLHWALWNRDGCFDHKGAYDMALADCHAARRIMERLIKGRSAAQVARMERERGLDRTACANEERAR